MVAPFYIPISDAQECQQKIELLLGREPIFLWKYSRMFYMQKTLEWRAPEALGVRSPITLKASYRMKWKLDKMFSEAPSLVKYQLVYIHMTYWAANKHEVYLIFLYIICSTGGSLG